MLEQHLAAASPDLLRKMIASLANAMMTAQADQVCNNGINRRNGCRARQWTPVGMVE
jgi:putative transposase